MEQVYVNVDHTVYGPGLVIAQVEVDKTNEIKALRPLLAHLDISGVVITADAMHTQTDAAKFIVDEKHSHLSSASRKTSSTCGKPRSSVQPTRSASRPASWPVSWRVHH